MSDKEAAARLAIAAQYARLDAAVRGKDLDAIRALHAPEYRLLQVSGEERDLAQAMAEWRGDLAAMSEPRLQTELHEFDPHGNAADVTVRVVQSFIEELSASLRLAYRIETTRRDRWTDTDAGWRLIRAQEQASRSWINDRLDRETTFAPPLTAEQRQAVVRDLRARALPFETVRAGGGFDDLAGLDALIGDARIVALGEASHGTAEFFQARHRVLEYLVERKGFTVLAIEANWPEALGADRFVKTREGDAAAALAALYFWPWQTREASALLDWMRHYNATRSDRPALSCAGFDMQVANAAVAQVLEFLDRTGGADRGAVRALYYDGMEKLDPWGAAIAAEDNARLAERASKALDLIAARRDALVAASTPGEYRDMQQAARIVWQAFARRAGALERDAAMAQNVRWLIEEGFPAQKIVLWAHNGHVGTDMGGSERSLGSHLRDRYGDQMVVIGMTTHHGTVRAKRVEQGALRPGPPVAMRLAPASKVSVEALFAQTGLPRFMLDLRDLPGDSAAGAWLARPRLHRMIGADYDPDRTSRYYAQVHLPAMYDCVVFIAESTAATPLT
jgi:erythromycin esterase